MTMTSTLTIPSTGDFVVKTNIVPVTHAKLVDEAIEAALNTPVELDDAAAASSAIFRPPHGRQYGPKNAWQLPEWIPGEDDEAMRWAVSTYDSRQRKALRILVDKNGEFIPTGKLLPAAGYEEGTRASGVFRAIAGACRAVGRKPFWDGAATQGKGRRLHIHPDRAEVRKMLDAALKHYGA
jgi:hypothetical protein